MAKCCHISWCKAGVQDFPLIAEDNLSHAQEIRYTFLIFCSGLLPSGLLIGNGGCSCPFGNVVVSGR